MLKGLICLAGFGGPSCGEVLCVLPLCRASRGGVRLRGSAVSRRCPACGLQMRPRPDQCPGAEADPCRGTDRERVVRDPKGPPVLLSQAVPAIALIPALSLMMRGVARTRVVAFVIARGLLMQISRPTLAVIFPKFVRVEEIR